MGMVVLLVDGLAEDLSLGPETSSSLAALGVTYAAVLADGDGTAILLDGRRFDPDRALGVALRAMGTTQATRTLRPRAQMTIPAE